MGCGARPAGRQLPRAARGRPGLQRPPLRPLWSAVAEAGLPLVTHSASGETGANPNGVGSLMPWMSEVMWFSRRGAGSGSSSFGRVLDETS
jgi:hypothetical protein